MVQYTQASVIQTFLQLAHATSFWSLSKMPRPKSSSSSRKNTNNSSDRNTNTEISPSKPIPISPNQVNNESRSESIGSNPSPTGYSPMDKALSGKQPISKNSPSPSSIGSPFSTPPKQTSIASNFKRTPSNEKIRRDSFSYSPMPPFVLQEQYEKQYNHHQTTTSGIAIAGSFEDYFPISPPFPKNSSNLLSTSPQTNVWTLQANIGNMIKTNDDTKESILHIIREFESKVSFPKSPFDIINDGCEMDRNNTIEEDSNDLLLKEKDTTTLFEVDEYDDNSLSDEIMPFAFPNPNVNSITLVSPSNQPITQLSMEILVSFNDVEYPNGKELQKYIMEKANEIKKSI